MKKSELQEIRSKSTNDNKKQLSELQKELARTKLAITMGKETNVRAGYNLRRKMAVLQTVIREKELGGQLAE